VPVQGRSKRWGEPGREGSRKEESRMEQELKVFVGIDWGWEEHQLCVLDAEGKLLLKRKIAHEVRAL
jgi:hypothetical protein